MAVAAIDTQAADMVLVTECDGLLARLVLHRLVRGTDDHPAKPCQEADCKYSAEKADSRNRIRIFTEILRHYPPIDFRPGLSNKARWRPPENA